MTNKPAAEIDLEAIRERCEKATEGPWEWSGPTPNELSKGVNRCYVHRVPGCGGDNIPPEKFFISIQSVGTQERDYADASFIAHVRQDIPALLSEVDRLNSARADLARKFIEAVKQPNGAEGWQPTSGDVVAVTRVLEAVARDAGVEID